MSKLKGAAAEKVYGRDEQRQFEPPEVMLGKVKTILEAMGVQFAEGASITAILNAVVDVLVGEDLGKLSLASTAGGSTVHSMVSDLPPGKERDLIANALAQHSGHVKTAMIALQKELMQPMIDLGSTVAHAVKALKPRYPHIF